MKIYETIKLESSLAENKRTAKILEEKVTKTKDLIF